MNNAGPLRTFIGLKVTPDIAQSLLNSLEMPISTLYASPENIRDDLFCAFHPKRLTVPSFPFLFTCPDLPLPDSTIFALPRIPKARF
jgi:hypothetical protein